MLLQPPRSGVLSPGPAGGTIVTMTAPRKPRKIDPATGRPYAAGKGSLAHLKPQRRRRWAPARIPMALDPAYDEQPPAEGSPKP